MIIVTLLTSFTPFTVVFRTLFLNAITVGASDSSSTNFKSILSPNTSVLNFLLDSNFSIKTYI